MSTLRQATVTTTKLPILRHTPDIKDYRRRKKMPRSTFLMANVLGEEGADRDPEEPGEGHHNPELVADGLQGDVVATRRRPARRTRS